MPLSIPLAKLATVPALTRLGVVTAGLLALFLAWFGWQSWRDGERVQLREMRTVLEITATAIDRYLREVEAGLGAVAYDLENEDGMGDLAQVQKTLRRFHDAHPNAASITLSRRADGVVLASSTTTRLEGLPANTGGAEPIFPRNTDESALAGRLVLGRPLLGALVKQWVFPLAYMVYGPDRKIVAVLTMAMPVDFVQAFWIAAPLSPSMTIGLVRDDGMLVSRWKLPENVPLSEIYGVRRTGALQRHLVAGGHPASGYVEGYNELSGAMTGNVFRRLPHFEVTAFVSMPASELRTAWWQRVRIPYLLALVLAGGSFLGYRAILRRQAAIEAERRSAEVAARASEAKSEFIAKMSHELRTPLNAVLGLAELMSIDRASPLRPEQLERVGHIRRAGQHLLSLINELLDVSQIEAGTVRVDFSTFRLSELFDEVVREMEPMAAQRDVRIVLQTRFGEADLACTARTRLKQILLNLLSNAIKYNEAHGEVVIEAAATPGWLSFSVIDSGAGMTPAQLGSLFQPFNRLGREGSSVGTGIGLIITRSLVQMLRGRLDVQSTAGAGSRFDVEIPLERPPADAPPALSAAPAAGAPAGEPALPPAFAAGRAVSIVYVDDDEVNRIIVAGYLERVPDVALRLAGDGPECLALARALRPDVMLVDLMMPGMDGTDVMRAVRADHTLRHTLCIALSANAMPDEIRAARAAGFDGYVTKPISAASLHAEIARVLAVRL